MSETPDSLYDSAFFDCQIAGSAASARNVVPVVLEILRAQGIRSVVDVGCGTGVWLAEFQRCGVDEVLGIDGDYVPPGVRRIAAHAFLARDIAREVRLEKTYDLAVSLEVAEHLPPNRGESFVADLCLAAPTVLFSACPPTPGHGTGHINERPQSYWAAKFQAHGYVASSLVRERIWSIPEVEWFYRQNIVLYTTPEIAARCAIPTRHLGELDVYHPGFVKILIAESVNRHSAWALVRLLMRRVGGRLRRLSRRKPADVP